MPQNESRFITCPSIEPKNAHAILIIDSSDKDLEQITQFCSITPEVYDIYLYSADTSELQWLNHVVSIVDDVLIRDTSTVTMSDSVGAFIFGPDRTYETPLQFLNQI